MSFFAWSDEFSVGNAAIDKDHQHLVELVNRLHQAMAQGQGNQVLGVTLEELIVYTKQHFRREENEMARIGYPRAAEHRMEHEKLLRDAQNLQTLFIQGKTMLTIQVSKFLKEWLVNHIQKSDKALGEAIRNAKRIA